MMFRGLNCSLSGRRFDFPIAAVHSDGPVGGFGEGGRPGHDTSSSVLNWQVPAGDGSLAVGPRRVISTRL